MSDFHNSFKPPPPERRQNQQLRKQLFKGCNIVTPFCANCKHTFVEISKNMTTSNFSSHDIFNCFGKGKVQEFSRRLRELQIYPKHEELTNQHAAALLFGLTFDTPAELVGAIQIKAKDFNEVVQSLALLLGSPEMLTDVENIEFYQTGFTSRFENHSHFTGTRSKSEIITKTEISGDWLRLFGRAMQDDHFVGNSF